MSQHGLFQPQKNPWLIPELRVGFQTLAILKDMHRSQLHFISFPPPILILVFPQSATFQVYIVWRARDGQVGEGILELAYPSSGWATLYQDQYIQKHSRTFAISAFLSLPRYTNFYFKNPIKLNIMYPCVLKVFSVCWRTQKSSRQDPIFFKVLQKGRFSQHCEWCATEMAKRKGLRQAERLLASQLQSSAVVWLQTSSLCFTISSSSLHRTSQLSPFTCDNSFIVTLLLLLTKFIWCFPYSLKSSFIFNMYSNHWS